MGHGQRLVEAFSVLGKQTKDPTEKITYPTFKVFRRAFVS